MTPDVIYFVNCEGPAGDARSALLHYPAIDIQTQNAGQQPDQVQYVTIGSFRKWEGLEYEMTDPRAPMHIRFFIDINAASLKANQLAGDANRIDINQNLPIYRANNALLCTLSNGFKCFRIYTCTAAHLPNHGLSPPNGTGPFTPPTNPIGTGSGDPSNGWNPGWGLGLGHGVPSGPANTAPGSDPIEWPQYGGSPLQ